MGRALGIVLLALGSLVLVSGCGLPTARISARGGPLYLDGDVSAHASSDIVSPSGKASAKDLGLDDPEVVFQPKAEMDWGGFNLSLDGFATGFSGTGIATVDLEIGNRPPVEAGAMVRSKLDLTYLMLKATYDLIPTDVIDVGIGLGGGIVDYDVSVSETHGIGSFKSAETVPVIYPVIRVGSLLGPVRIAGYLGGIGGTFEGDKIRYIDGEIYAGLRVFGGDSRVQGWISVGYRYMDFVYKYNSGSSDVDLSAQLKGPYLSVELTF